MCNYNLILIIIKLLNMKKSQKKSNKLASLPKKKYIAPDVEVIEIEIEQNIFAGSNNGIPGFGGEGWGQ